MSTLLTIIGIIFAILGVAIILFVLALYIDLKQDHLGKPQP
jgi:hypothetical protein